MIEQEDTRIHPPDEMDILCTVLCFLFYAQQILIDDVAHSLQTAGLILDVAVVFQRISFQRLEVRFAGNDICADAGS